MTATGRKQWVIPGGHIPLRSTGQEPTFTSRDELFLLNMGDAPAQVALTIYYADREPVEGYHLEVGARRVRQVRCNDLIDPEAMPLDVDYALLVSADRPIVVQFTRVETSQPALALATTLAFPGEM